MLDALRYFFKCACGGGGGRDFYRSLLFCWPEMVKTITVAQSGRCSGSNDLLCCPHCSQQDCSFCSGAAVIPNDDTVGQGAFDSSCVECCHDECRWVGHFQSMQKVKVLLGFLDEDSVSRPGHAVCNEHPLETVLLTFSMEAFLMFQQHCFLS